MFFKEQKGGGKKRAKKQKVKYDSFEKFAGRSSLFKTTISYNDKFSIVSKNIRIADNLNLKEDSFIEINKKITKFINDMYLEMTHNMDPDDQICTAIFHPSLDIPISIGFMNLEDFTPQLLENEITKVCQSKRALRIDQSLEIKCKIAKIMKGSGLPADDDDDDDDDDDADNMMHLNTLFKTKRSVKRIAQPKDHLCAVRACLVAKHYVDHDVKSVRNFLRAKNRLLESETADVAKSLGFDNSRPLGLSDIAKLEWFFKDYQVTVYDHNSRFTSSKHPVYRGPLATKFIYLLLFKHHFWPIVPIGL